MPPPFFDWRDLLQPATFRSVPFFVESHEMNGGRAVVVFEIAHAEQAPFVEDLGRRANRFEVEAYVIGPNYFEARNALLSALQDGRGILVHPYLGQKFVQVQSWRLKETRREGGMASFGIDFIEAVDQQASQSTDVFGVSLDDSADGALTSIQDGYLAQFQATLPGAASGPGPAGPSFLAPGLSVPAFSLQSVAQVLVDWTGAVRSAMSPIVRTTQALADMKSQLDALVRDSAVLVRTPTSLLTRLGTVATSMLDWPDTPRLGIAALLAAFHFTRTAVRPDASTASRLIEQQNQDAIAALLQGVTIVQAARFAVQAITAPSRTISTALRVNQVDATAGYDSYQDAVAVREAITSAIDLLSETASDDVFAALQQVRADLAAAVPGSPNRLPQIVSLTPPVTVPALVLSQRLYGDLSLVDDIVARNSVAHPGFVPGGVPLQVLSNV